MLQAMVVIALALWGYVLPMHVTVVRSDADPHGFVAFTDGGLTDPAHPLDTCDILVMSRNFDQLTPHLQQNAITHEVGHCLGLQHLDVPGIMFPSVAYDFTDADRAEYRRVHDPLRRAFAFVAAD